MPAEFDPALKAHLHRDDQGRVRQIQHSQAYWLSNKATALEAASDYLAAVADRLRMNRDQLANLHQGVNHLEPEERGVEYRKSAEKQFFDSTTVAFEQTCLNVPVWRAGCTVTVKHNPNRVVGLTDSSQDGVSARLPPKKAWEPLRQLFFLADLERTARKSGNAPRESATAAFVRSLVDRRQAPRAAAPPRGKEGDDAHLIRGRFFVYRYRKDERLPAPEAGAPDAANARASARPEALKRTAAKGQESGDATPVLPLAPVPSRIRDGRDYLVAEVTFSYATQAWGRINWLALVEVESRTVLYLRPLAAAVNGLVFHYDPITATGNTANSSDQANAVLNPRRSSRLLENLNAATGGTQSLVGAFVDVTTNQEDPNIAAPTQSGADFDYAVRTNEFAAVNAYYHADRFFRLVASLGFPVSTYFNNTAFPVPIDFRGLGGTGQQINAHCVGNGVGGIGHCCYGLGDLSDTANPIGRAVDWWVHCHEMGGHGILYEHVNSANFGFAHSAGDTLAALQNDPESQLASTTDRFIYAPFRPNLGRRFDRDPTTGWGWGGSQDLGGYNSEQILCTTLFRAYRSIGGDSADLGRRWFASRMMTYLLLRAVSTLTPATNPGNALGFANALLAVDPLNWTSEGVFGGAYGKVIRWAFEKQGLYQGAGAPSPVTGPGQPPDVDVYIDDGRGGEYPYQPVHWANPSIWNRTAADGGTSHQEPVMGETNYVYVKIKNRGTQPAQNVRVKGFHSMPGAGLLWPADFQPLATAELTTAALPGNNAEERTIGPFAWTPSTNAYGHDCLLMVVVADQDPSNVDNFVAGESIPEWRLVPNDNNVGQRNVYPVPGGGGEHGLAEALVGRFFLVGNPNPRDALIRLEVHLPGLLAERGWRLSLEGMEKEFKLAPGQKRKVALRLQPGRPFTRREVEQAKDRDIVVSAFADGILLGGMTYRLDPAIEATANRPGKRPHAPCLDKAKDLLDCLDLPGDSLRRVRIRKVSVDFEMKDDDRRQ